MLQQDQGKGTRPIVQKSCKGFFRKGLSFQKKKETQPLRFELRRTKSNRFPVVKLQVYPLNQLGHSCISCKKERIFLFDSRRIFDEFSTNFSRQITIYTTLTSLVERDRDGDGEKKKRKKSESMYFSFRASALPLFLPPPTRMAAAGANELIDLFKSISLDEKIAK